MTIDDVIEKIEKIDKELLNKENTAFEKIDWYIAKSVLTNHLIKLIKEERREARMKNMDDYGVLINSHQKNLVNSRVAPCF